MAQDGLRWTLCLGSSSEDLLSPLRLLQVLLMLTLSARGQCMAQATQRQTSSGPMPGFFFRGSSSPSAYSSGIINAESRKEADFFGSYA